MQRKVSQSACQHSCTAPTDAGLFCRLFGLCVLTLCQLLLLCCCVDDVELLHGVQVERSKKRLSLGLKPRYFEGDADSSDEGSEGEEGSDEDSEGEEADSSDDDMDAMVAAAAMDVSEGEESQDEDEDVEEEESDDEESSEEEEEEESSRSLKRPRGVMGEGLGGASSSGGANAFSLNFGDLGSMGGAAASSDEDEDSDEDSDDDAGASG